MNNLFIYLIIFKIIDCNNYITQLNKTKKNLYLNKPIIIYNLKSNEAVIHKKNVILSMVVKYDWEKIAPFIISFYESNIIDCDLVLFISGVSQNVIDILKSYGIILYQIPNEYIKLNVPVYRWKMYLDFLNENKEKYNFVLSVDIRDSIIQNDLFKYYSTNNSFLSFSFEDGNLNYSFNKIWMINFFGYKVQRLLMHKKTICAGTVWGTLNKFLEFANILWEKLLERPNVVDQTYVNYLIYYEHLFKDDIIIKDNFGPVITIGLTKRDKINLDINRNILNFGGQIASIVHQYDRHPDLLKIVRTKFSSQIINNIKKSSQKLFSLYNYSKININNLRKNKAFLYEIKKFKSNYEFLLLSLVILLLLKKIIKKPTMNLSIII